MADYKNIELDIWTDNIERFRTEFASMNDVKFDYMEVIAVQGVDKRYSLEYRNFGGELNFPEQGYYQLKNCWEAEEMDKQELGSKIQCQKCLKIFGSLEMNQDKEGNHICPFCGSDHYYLYEEGETE